MNLFGIKQYLIALFPLAIIVLVFNNIAAIGQFLYRSGIIGRVHFRRDVRRILLFRAKRTRLIYLWYYEDEGDDDNPHR